MVWIEQQRGAIVLQREGMRVVCVVAKSAFVVWDNARLIKTIALSASIGHNSYQICLNRRAEVGQRIVVATQTMQKRATK